MKHKDIYKSAASFPANTGDIIRLTLIESVPLVMQVPANPPKTVELIVGMVEGTKEALFTKAGRLTAGAVAILSDNAVESATDCKASIVPPRQPGYHGD